jgi:hypothetical protein
MIMPILTTTPAENLLIERLADDRARLYFGRGFALRCEVLSAIHAGDRSLYSIAKEYAVSRQAVSRIAARARQIYGQSPAS